MNFVREGVTPFHVLLKWPCVIFSFAKGITILNRADGRSWAKASGRDEAKNAWRYDRLIYSSIDLSVILNNAIEYKWENVLHFIGLFGKPCSGACWTMCTIVPSKLNICFRLFAYRYRSLEEYWADCSTVVHNVAVYFGANAYTKGFHRGLIDDIKVRSTLSRVRCDLWIRFR